MRISQLCPIYWVHIEEIHLSLIIIKYRNISLFINKYQDTLRTIYDNYTAIPLSENYIKQLHSMLLSNVSKDERHRGEYKNVDNAVASFDSTSKEIGIIFRTASPFETPILL